MENIKDYQQYLRGYNYTGITPVIIDFYATWCGHYDLQLMIVRMIHNYNYIKGSDSVIHLQS